MDGASVGAQVMIHNTHQCTMQDEMVCGKETFFFFFGAIFLSQWDITRVINYVLISVVFFIFQKKEIINGFF
jgi:hypothetical protein